MLLSLFIVGFRVVDFHGYSDKAIFQELFLSEMLKCTPESNVAGTSGVTRLMLKKYRKIPKISPSMYKPLLI